MRTSTPANVLAVAIAISVVRPMSLAGIVAPGCAAHADTKSGESTPARRAAFQEGLYCTNAVPEKIQCPAIIEKDVAVMRVFVPFQQKINTAMGMPSSDCKYEKICWSVLAELGKLPPSASRTAAIESTLDFLNKHLSASTSGSAASVDSTDATNSAPSVNSVDEVLCFTAYVDALAADDAGDILAAEKLYSKSQEKAVRLQNHQSDLYKEYPAACDYALSEINRGYGDFLLRHYKDYPASARDYPHALKDVFGLQYHATYPVWKFDRVKKQWDYRGERVKIYDLIEVPSFQSKPSPREHLFSEPNGSCRFAPYASPVLPFVFFL